MKRLSEEFASSDIEYQILDAGRADMGSGREQALLAQVLLAAGVPVTTLAASTGNASAAPTAATSSGKAAGALASSGKIALLTVVIGVSAWRYFTVTPSAVSPGVVSPSAVSVSSDLLVTAPALVVLAEPVVSEPTVGNPTEGIDDDRNSVATNAAEKTPDKVVEIAKPKPVVQIDGPRKKRIQQIVNNGAADKAPASKDKAGPIAQATATTTLEANSEVEHPPLPDDLTPVVSQGPSSTKPKSPPASTLAEEARQLRITRSLISSGEWTQAERAYSSYQRQFPKGALAQDMGYLRLQIIAELHPHLLSSKVSHFLERHPSSPYRDKVRRLLK